MKVAKIVDPEFRTGTGKKGKWTLVKIETDSGVVATGFTPITVGDEVELIKNEQYNNYSFKKLEGSSIPTIDQNEDLKQTTSAISGQFKLIYSELRKQTALLEKLAGDPSEKATEQIVEPTEAQLSGEEEINLDDIPF